LPFTVAELSQTPPRRVRPFLPFAAVNDSAFRANVTRLYLRMRGALVAGDLKSFGIAYDSLGLVIGRR
jgi:hypothetical protein